MRFGIRCLAAALVVALVGTATPTAVAAAEGVIIVDPVRDRADQRLNGTPKPPQWKSAPIVITSPILAAEPNAGSVAPAAEGSQPPGPPTPLSLETSFTQWSAFEANAKADEIESVRARAPYAFAKPPVLVSDPTLDVWFSVDASQPVTGKVGERFSRLGADYKIGRLAVLGFAVADKEADNGLKRAQSAASYFAWRPLQTVTLDGRLGIASAHSGPIDGAQEVMQAFASARVRSDWNLGSFKLSPALSLTRGTELDTPAHAGSQDNGILSIAPRLSRSFDLGNGQQLEPFVTIDRKLAIGNVEPTTPGGEPLSSSRSVGAGMSLKQKDSYSLDVTTSVEERDIDGQHNLKSGLKVKVPLN
jgi:hypothetical protein